MKLRIQYKDRTYEIKKFTFKQFQKWFLTLKQDPDWKNIDYFEMLEWGGR